MHPEHSAMISRLVMEERVREAEAHRRLGRARGRRRRAVRSGLGGLLVRAGNRLSGPRPVPTARRA